MHTSRINPNINGSVAIRFMPATSSWTGYVVDSYGTGYGGVSVTLHIRNASNGEIYNMTTTTSTSKPFVGLYVFDNVVPTPDIAWAFADASAQLTDNMTIYGRSNNYSLNKSSTSSGFIVLHVPPPDAIYVTADPVYDPGRRRHVDHHCTAVLERPAVPQVKH